MEWRKIANLLDPTSDNVPRFITIKWIEVYDQVVQVVLKIDINQLNQ